MQPTRFLPNPSAAAGIITRFPQGDRRSDTSYATVRDYCESVDQFPQIAATDGDLKNVQRPWAVKAVLRSLPPPARLLEIGGGEPVVSGFLSELGYDVTLVDPYDGFGNGPTDFERYRECFPHVKIVREYFRPRMPALAPSSFDAIFSVSVLEHLNAESLTSCFAAIAEFLRPGGASVHCFDFILQGAGDAHNLVSAQGILAAQANLTGEPLTGDFQLFLEKIKADLETFYLSPQGHHNWRGGRPYDEFPFRKVVSLQSIVFRPQPA